MFPRSAPYIGREAGVPLRKTPPLQTPPPHPPPDAQRRHPSAPDPRTFSGHIPPTKGLRASPTNEVAAGEKTRVGLQKRIEKHWNCIAFRRRGGNRVEGQPSRGQPCRGVSARAGAVRRRRARPVAHRSRSRFASVRPSTRTSVATSFSISAGTEKWPTRCLVGKASHTRNLLETTTPHAFPLHPSSRTTPKPPPSRKRQPANPDSPAGPPPHHRNPQTPTPTTCLFFFGGGGYFFFASSGRRAAPRARPPRPNRWSQAAGRPGPGGDPIVRGCKLNT
jgi:hypothetical protein